MSSIVYITDKEMLEYHRLNGDKTMNFWRPGSLRKMADFYPGDFLFFLAKGTERGITREKGIVGYGRYKQGKSMSMKQMWKTFGTENGFDNEEKFREAVLKVSKSKDSVKNMSGLYLSSCVYFQSPIYLSEIGVKVSNMVESYFYLDKDDPQATTKILEKAKEVGLDSWMAMMNDEEEDLSLEEDSCRHIISEVMSQCFPIYNENETKKAVKMCNSMTDSLEKDGLNVEKIKGVEGTILSIEDKKVEIFVPLVSTTKDLYKKIQGVIGSATVVKGLLKQKHLNYNVEVTIIVNSELSLEQQQMFHAGSVSYLYLDN